MKSGIWLTIVMVLIISTAAVGNDWRATLDELVATENPEKRGELIGQIAGTAPAWSEVAAYLKRLSYPPVPVDTFLLDSTVCIDGVTRPFVVYVPPAYDPKVSRPLIVALHGGVSRGNIHSDPVGYAREHYLPAWAKEGGYLLLFPFGQQGATWWDKVGMANIKNLIRHVKRHYHVDDDRVYMAGFSDGGSAAFLQAMLDPNDYAGFFALNGHMGVGSLDGNLPLYAVNMANTPIYAITSDMDYYYPTHIMRPTIEMALEAGADIVYHEHEGPHEFTYGDYELPLFAQFIERHPRDPFPPHITWETADSRFGTCRWFAIDEITLESPAAWHRDYNIPMVDSLITIGFVDDNTYEGRGMLVGSVIDGETMANEIGLLPGDIITAANEFKIDSTRDLRDFKASVTFGDSVAFSIRRNDKELLLTGEIMGPRQFMLFKRDVPSAAARVTALGNRVEIESSRVGAIRILIHPDMFRLDQNLAVIVNGKTVYDAPIEPDLKYMLRNFMDNRDSSLLYVGEVEINL